MSRICQLPTACVGNNNNFLLTRFLPESGDTENKALAEIYFVCSLFHRSGKARGNGMSRDSVATGEIALFSFIFTLAEKARGGSKLRESEECSNWWNLSIALTIFAVRQTERVCEIERAAEAPL